MRKSSPVVGGLFLAAAFSAAAQQEDAFHVRGLNGELVHVLPTVASAKAQEHGTQPTDAPITGYAVYPYSYGSGKLTYRGGRVIQNAGVYSIFYDSSIPANVSTGINAFLNAFGGNQNYNVVTEYYGNNGAIPANVANAGAYYDHAGTPNSISDGGVQKYIAGLMNAGRIPVSTAYVYGVYLPPGTKSVMQGGSSCSSYCGYHNHFTYNGKEIKYAVYPYLTCSGCSLSGKSVLDMLTIVTSHEIREAVTDPMEGGQSTWRDASGYEADDKCAWHNLFTISGYWVQPEFSNQANGCVVY